MVRRTLRFATFLAPDLYPVYSFIVRYVGERLGCRTEFFVGACYQEMTEKADAAFICGLAYVEMERDIEPLAAPLLHGERYGGRPVYFSDVIVRRDSPYRTFADLRGCVWSYNEPLSHSGYGVTRYRLTELGETSGFFARVVEAGWHARSIEMVCSGEADASAIDSHLLAVATRRRPELRLRLRVIDTFGPSTIQPVVASRRLPERIKADLRAALVEMGNDPAIRRQLARGLIDRFVPVNDSSYDDLRRMRDACIRANFLTIH